jgi:hypothetical protein
MKKRIIAGVTTVGIVGAAGVAFAALGGFLNVPDAVQGLVSGNGAASCQTNGVTFTVPDPTWNNTLGTYEVSTLGYSGISTTCQNLGTADLDVRVWNGSVTLASGVVSNMVSGSGVISLSNPVEFDAAVNANYIYLVKDN